MKRITVIVCLLSVCLGVFALYTGKNNRDMTELYLNINTPFVPVTQTSYYDAQFSANYSNALQLQNIAGNVYLSYMFKEFATSGRRSVNFAALNPQQNTLLFQNCITNSASNEGGISMAIDKTTQNPFFAWHAQYPNDLIGNVYLAADYFSFANEFGRISNPLLVIENTSDEFCYISPSVYIGPAPNNQGRRIYVFALNAGAKPNGQPSSNVKMAFADFNNSLFENENLVLNWQYRCFDYLNAIHHTPLTARAFPSFYVKDNIVIIGGSVIAKQGISYADDPQDLMYQPHNTFFLVNTNFGEGDFQTYTFNTNRELNSPTNQNGTPDNLGYSYKVEEFLSSNRTLEMDNFNRIHFIDNYVTTYLEHPNDTEDMRKYIPTSQSIKDIRFSLSDHQLSICAIEPKSSSNMNNQLFPVWDLNGDDAPDSFNVDSHWANQWRDIPMHHWQTDNWFFYHYFRQTNATNDGWMAAVWSDCTKSYVYNVEGEQEYAEYAEVPELAITVSKDNGQTWCNVKYLNSLNTPELNGITLATTYLAQDIEVIDEDHGRLHLMSYNDNSYGSYMYGDGQNTGGNVVYFSIDIDFSQFSDTDEITVVNPVKLNQNYPNPFNPETNIAFTLNQPQNAEINIYNVKGQLVNKLCNKNFSAGTHTVKWNGKDDSGRNAGSGVYFYKLTAGNNSITKKMLLLK